MTPKPDMTYHKPEIGFKIDGEARNPWTKDQHSRKAWARKDLPIYYYHSNFCEMLDFVAQKNQICLTDEAQAFLKNFYSLPLAAQCLYARMAGRKGNVFNIDKFNYAEIDELPTQAKHLKGAGFIKPLMHSDYAAYLQTLTKPDLVALLGQHISQEKFRKSWTKPLLIDTALRAIPFERAAPSESFVRQGHSRALGFIMFLYFGVVGDSLQNFTMRDLGLVKPPDLKDDYGPRFETPDLAKTAFFYDAHLHLFKIGTDEDIENMHTSLPKWPKPLCARSHTSREKLLGKLGSHAERGGGN